MPFEQTDGAVQSFDGRAEVLARSRRQLSHQGDFPQQLQGVADVLDRPLGIGGSQGPAAPVERAASFGTPTPINQPAALFCHNRDSLTTWL